MNSLADRSLVRQRHYGLDFLRILAMLMIVVLHVLGRGGIAGAVTGGSVSYYMTRGIHYAVMCAVNAYAMLSGYFGIGRKNRFASIASLWLQVLVYSLGITLLLRLGFGRGGRLLDAALPVLSKQYWYFTAYFVLFLLAPVLNAALEKLSASQLGTLLLVTGAAFSIGVYFDDVFILNNGYSAHWLIYLYLLGGMFRKTGTGTRRLRWVLVFAAAVILNVLAVTVSLRLRWKHAGLQEAYTNPLLVLGAVSMFLFCANLKIVSGSFRAKLIGAVAPLCFGVYLIHTHPAVFKLLHNAFAFLGKRNPVIMVSGLLAIALGIFLVCCAIEALRQLVFRWLRIRKLLDVIGKRLEALTEKLFRSL